MNTTEFDGFYFLPGDEDDQLKFAYFKVGENHPTGEKVETTQIGDMYHVAFFKESEDGHPKFDEEFEAIFADPATYITNLIGCSLYGCMFRKTENSSKWWNEYLTKAKENCEEICLENSGQANT
jgi:hypothetical protein